MPSTHPQLEAMLLLAERQCNGTAGRDDITRLEALLVDDAALRREYLRYTFLHAHLASSDMVVGSVFDEAQLSNLTDQRQLDEYLAELPETSFADLLRRESGHAGQPRLTLKSVGVFASAGVLVAVLLLSLFFVPAPTGDLAWKKSSIARVTDVDGAHWAKGHRALRPGQDLRPGTLRLQRGYARVKFRDGAQVALSGRTTLGLESESNASLFTGRMWARLDEHHAGHFTLQAGPVRVIDRGTEFGVEVVRGGATEIHCLEGKIETQARARLPRFFWNFDESDSQVFDTMTGRQARVGLGVKRVAGLVGDGAMWFDNTGAAAINVGNGGGAQLGAGEFGVSSGLTIEVLAIIRWPEQRNLGEGVRAYDEIFRKEDGPKRMLLSFQDDGGAWQPMIPKFTPNGPTLSFGLHLAGEDYSELEVPLDGQQGRPSLDDLRDERPHHIVATYDSWSGVKALYIDGQLCQQARFPRGALIEAGGPTDATIGNMANGNEPYSGILDEVALYDFALTAEEVAAHWRRAQTGQNYFGADQVATLRQAAWRTTRVLEAGQAMRFDSVTGLPLGPIPVDHQRFRKE